MIGEGRTRTLVGLAGARSAALHLPTIRGAIERALAKEREERRFFLWIPVAAIGGVALNFAADREPVLWLPAIALVAFLGLAAFAVGRPLARGVLLGLAAVAVGFLSVSLRIERVATPLLTSVRIASFQGVVEELDPRVSGARLVLRITDAGDLRPPVPRRVRLTMRAMPNFGAGDFIAVKARLLPPSQAVLPSGYDFARDAFFSGVGGVGSILGPVRAAPPPRDEPMSDRIAAAIDRARNALAARVDAIVGGDEGAIAAAMVTGKRDFLSSNAKDLIREAGIFHIITISGVQMTLVAGILFWTTRRLLACSPTLALRFPIKKWSAAVAIIGACLYDLATGSRVGTERALIMTTIVLGAVILDRRALTMRNLAVAVLAVVVLEPEAILGVSFQLSFAAVAALVAVMEARVAGRETRPDPLSAPPAAARAARGPRPSVVARALEKPLELLFATACATGATASFIAYHFHDLSPYVLIGNPLTLSVIEFFAVPGALLGAALYPIGLDAPIWLYVGAGIRFILWIARFIAGAPDSTLHLPAFAPWALPFLALAVANAVIWRTAIFRLLAVPCFVVGVWGAISGARYDALIAPTGDLVAVRDDQGRLVVVGARFNAFAAEQWLAADGDDSEPGAARDPDPSCDRLGCVAALPEGQSLAIVVDRLAFETDCSRAQVVASALVAPKSCQAPLVFDQARLAQTGAIGLQWDGARFVVATDRAALEDRAWSPAPKTSKGEGIVRTSTRHEEEPDPADPTDDEPGSP